VENGFSILFCHGGQFNMFDLSFFNLELFSFVLFASLPVLFGDIESWLPDFGKWLGPQVQKVIDVIDVFGDFISEKVKGFIGTIIESIQSFGNAVYELISSLWAYLKGAFQSILDFFADIWDWILETVTNTYEFFSELVTSVWETIIETIELGCEWFLDLLWYIGEWLWELLLSCCDSIVQLLFEIFKWFFDKLPAINLPSGFEDGVTYLIQFGMILNEILPIREALSLFALYIAIFVALIIYRTVKTIISFIPFV
jgi:phage-related protein